MRVTSPEGRSRRTANAMPPWSRHRMDNTPSKSAGVSACYSRRAFMGRKTRTFLVPGFGERVQSDLLDVAVLASRRLLSRCPRRLRAKLALNDVCYGCQLWDAPSRGDETTAN